VDSSIINFNIFSDECVTLAAAHEIHVVPVSQDRMDFAIQLGMDCGEDAVSSVGAKADQTVIHTSLDLVKLSA
jgi:hypothetical protein